jgi:hypothetical protein
LNPELQTLNTAPMEIKNETLFEATALPLPDTGDRPALVVIVKGTFAIAMDKIHPAAEQVPIAFGDSFYDGQEGGGIRYESDLAPHKPRTDVVLCGSAYAPGNRPCGQVDVGLTVGPVQKRLKVFGKRLWNHAGILSRRFVITEAQPFVAQAIRYSEAFGGIDETTGEYCDHNLSGKGFYALKTKANLAGKPLPQIEDPRYLIKSPADHPPPAGLGFYHRAWLPRARYAGTYDKAWRMVRSPRPPEDFNYRFYNGAHPDLQAEGYLQGNEPVELINLTPEGLMQFALPGVAPLCRVRRIHIKEAETITMNLDTLFIEPDQRRVCLVWRGRAPLTTLTAAGIDRLMIENRMSA